MRLAFPNGEHEEVAIGKGTISIGSAPDDDVTLTASGIGPSHALIIVDQRGITLAGGDESGHHEPMRVNDRAVVEKAILRLGDQLRIGPVAMVLRGQVAGGDIPDPLSPTAEREEPARYLLRGVSGLYQGRVMALTDRLGVGSDDACDLVIKQAGVAARHGSFELHGDVVYLRANDGALMDVNGNRVGSARLIPGDQITVGGERLVLETPGFVPGKAYGGDASGAEKSNTQVFKAPVLEAATPEPAAADQSDSRRRRENLVVAICLIISVAMLLWLAWIYISS